MKQFFYVRCLGDHTWLAKPANQGKFTKDIRKAAPLTEAEAKANGYGNAIYPLVPVAEVYGARTIKVAAMNIVNQILDMSGATVQQRQAINDKCDDLAVAVISQLAAGVPFGGVPFDPTRDSTDGPSNGERADHGMAAIKAHVIDSDPDTFGPMLEDWERVNLTEAPDDALTDLLANLMHYCHREGIEFYGENGVLPRAQLQFNKESGGAAL